MTSLDLNTDDLADLAPLAELVASGGVVVLSGAGLSTESGIPDYRGPETARRARQPMRFADFVRSPEGRARYWARSYVGWPRIAAAQPNVGHRAVAALEAAGLVTATLTQNVDRLHQRAGSRAVVELHGALAEVVCLGCEERSPRAALQDRLAACNPDFAERVAAGGIDAAQRPDGDAELDVDAFVVPACLRCGGELKPDVVFFGESVPTARVEAGTAAVAAAGLLLVLGSSLTVWSGYRFVRAAAAAGVPVAIVNLGPTRGDGHARWRLDAPTGAVLATLCARLDVAV